MGMVNIIQRLIVYIFITKNMCTIMCTLIRSGCPPFLFNTCRIGLWFEIVKSAYEVLKDGAKIDYPLGPCFFSSCMFGIVDKFGVNWCLFV